MLNRRTMVRSSAATLAAGLLLSTTARAEFPDRTVRIVVPFSAGGGTDLVARTMAAGLTAQLGQTVIVDNRPGASTIIGTDVVAHSAPDGYTVLIATLAHAVNPSLQKKLPYDTDKDFAPVSLIGRSTNILVVRADSTLRSVTDVVAAAKAAPGKLTYASQGIGTSAHMAGELFDNLADVKMRHIPYRGASPALTDVIGGQVDLMFATSAASTALIAAGRLRALGVTAAPGQSPIPGLPSIADMVPSYVVDSWYGLYVPRATPEAVISRLNAACNAVIGSEDFRHRTSEEGLRLTPGGPELLATLVSDDEARWRKVIAENGISKQ